MTSLWKSFPRFTTAMGCVLVVALIASAKSNLKVRCHVVVPKEYRKTPLNPPPSGEPEPVRYTVAYEAFWWNCVAVRAANLDAGCPFVASGTPAASAGAADGAMNAGFQIDEVLKKHTAIEVRKYLRSIAATAEAKEKMRHYFDKPRAEMVN